VHKWQAAAGGYPVLRALQCGELIIEESHARNLKDSLTSWWCYYRTAGT